jgi:hypothetical protein
VGKILVVYVEKSPNGLSASRPEEATGLWLAPIMPVDLLEKVD